MIHGPTSANWDVELDPIMMADWFNANAFAAFHTELVQPPPHSDSVLLGGIGKDGLASLSFTSNTISQVGTLGLFSRESSKPERRYCYTLSTQGMHLSCPLCVIWI